MTTNTAGSIVQAAYEDAGRCSLGNTISAAQSARGIARLVDIINLWATQGLKVWLQQDIAIPLTAGQGLYILSPTGDVVMTRPLQCLQGYYLTSQGVQQPLTVLSRQEFAQLSQVNINGAISSYFCDKQATFMGVYPWNVPDVTAATGTIHLILRVACPTPVLSTDGLVFPVEWVIALRWALADEISTGQAKDIQDRCAQRAQSYRSALEDFDVEDAPTSFAPDMRTGYGTNSFR
jgi:hypothetical protein